MPKQKAKKKVSKKQQAFSFSTFVKQHRVSVIISIVLLSLVFFGLLTWAQNKRADTIEAQNLTKELDALDVKMKPQFDAIIAAVDVKPTRTKHAKECTYPNTDGDPGRPSCGPAFMASYSSLSPEVATVLFEKIVTSSDNISYFRGEQVMKSRVADSNNPYRTFYITHDLTKDVRCAVEVRKNANSNKQKPYNVFVDFEYRCSAVTPDPVYPVFDYNNQ